MMVRCAHVTVLLVLLLSSVPILGSSSSSLGRAETAVASVLGRAESKLHEYALSSTESPKTPPPAKKKAGLGAAQEPSKNETVVMHGLRERVLRSGDFVRFKDMTCTGPGSVDVDASAFVAGIPATNVEARRAAIFAQCSKRCVADTSCLCFNIEDVGSKHPSCSLEQRRRRSFKAGAMAYMQALSAPVHAPHTKTVTNYSVVSGGGCRLFMDAQTAVSLGLAAPKTGKELVPANNLHGCQSKCAEFGCSCLQLKELKAEEKKEAGASSGSSYECKLYYGRLGRRVMFDPTASRGEATAVALAVVPTETPKVYKPIEVDIPASAGEIFAKLFNICVPLFVVLIFVYFSCGVPLWNWFLEKWARAKAAAARAAAAAFRQEHGHHKKHDDFRRHLGQHRKSAPHHIDLEAAAAAAPRKVSRRPTLATTATMVLEMAALDNDEDRMKKHPALFLTYYRDAQRFINPNSDAPMYDFPYRRDSTTGLPVVDHNELPPYRKEVHWNRYWILRWKDFFTLRGTVIKQAVKQSFLIACVTLLWSWAEVVFFLNEDKAGSDSVKRFDIHMSRIAHIHNELLIPGTFVITLTLGAAFSRWQGVLTTMWALQDPIQAVGFMIGSEFSRRPREDRPLAFRLYRYLNVVHVLTYTPVTECLSTLDVQDLVQCNLLTSAEADWLDRDELHTDGQRRRVLAWIWDCLQDCAERGMFEKTWNRVEKQLINVREMGSAMGSEFGRDLPFSWAQVAELLVVLCTFLCPFAFTYKLRLRGNCPDGVASCEQDDKHKIQVSFQLWAVLGTFVLCFFFYMLLYMIQTVTHSMDGKIDDFDPNAHMVETEQAMFFGFTEGVDLGDLKISEEDDEADGDGAITQLNKLLAEGVEQGRFSGLSAPDEGRS